MCTDAGRRAQRKYNASPQGKETRRKWKEKKSQKLQATHARQIEDMNEAQLEIEIKKLKRWKQSSEKEVERLSNTSSMRFFDDISKNFNGGVGGSAIDSKYKRMQERYSGDMKKLTEAQEKLDRRTETLARMEDAYQKVKGTGKTLRTVATATMSKGTGKWEKTTLQVYGETYKGEKMGDYIVSKPFFTYDIYDARTGEKVKTFKSKKAAKAYAEKGGTSK